jgi:hypothetical protein
MRASMPAGDIDTTRRLGGKASNPPQTAADAPRPVLRREGPHRAGWTRARPKATSPGGPGEPGEPNESALI